MAKHTLADRLRYRFDLTMAKGTKALIAYLFAATSVMVLVLAMLIVALRMAPEQDGGGEMSFGFVVWTTLLRTLDPGTIGGDSGGVGYLGALFVATLGGIFMVSILIGVINNGIEAKLDELRKGRSLVCEDDHTVIIGWSPLVFSIISEIAIANESRPHAAIAILADKDKVEMEDEIASKCPKLGKTRVICRTGSPIDPGDIAIVNPNEARSIVILAPEGDDPDSHVIKTMLAMTAKADRKTGRYHIVAEVREKRNIDVARLVARDEAEIVLAEELLSRITVQTSRQAGLSVVYLELLDFQGDEIYIRPEPSLVGKTFGEALFAYETCALIGLRRKTGVQLKPPMDTVIEPDDAVIAVAEDDSTLVVSSGATIRIDATALNEPAPRDVKPERTLILGWNQRGLSILRELDTYVPKGSEAKVVADSDDVAEQIAAECSGLENLTVTFERADSTDRQVLDRFAAAGYDHVLTLSYSDRLDPQAADARTLVTLLHLRDIEAKGGKKYSIVSEILDVRNRQLAEVAQADDFIVSDRLISLLLAQISESRDLKAVFDDLFDPEGSELYLKPAIDYVKPGVPVDFYTVVEAAKRRDEVAIGYRIASLGRDQGAAYGVRVNPVKSKTVTFTEEDKVIVLAEN